MSEEPEEKEDSTNSSKPDAVSRVLKMWSDYDAGQKMVREEAPGIVQAVLATSKRLEDVRNSVAEFAAYQSPLIRDAVYASQHMDKILEEARNTAEMIASANKRLPAYYVPYVNKVSKGLDEVEKTIDVINAEIETDPSPHNNKVEALLESVLESINSLRQDFETFKNEVKHNEQGLEIKRIPKRGPQRYSDQQKLEALKEWDELDKAFSAISLEEFLIRKFGENEDGSPLVAKSTFHGWRGTLKRKQKYRNS